MPVVPILVIQTPLATVSKEYIYWNQKVFHSAIREISKLYKLFDKLLYKLFQHYIKKSSYKLILVKLSANITDSSFILDSLSNAKIFQNFSTGNSFLFLKYFEV